MNEKEKISFSRFLSKILRHQPESIGISLDKNGWIDINELLFNCTIHGKKFSKEDLFDIVQSNDKQRFALSDDKTKIRANQGHSVSVDLELKPQKPPIILYHGTTEDVLFLIQKSGLNKMKRQHVHLSSDEEAAEKVGSRRKGKLVVLKVLSNKMFFDGYKFYRSDNGVWLTDHVPIDYIIF